MNSVGSGVLLLIFPRQMQCILETKGKDAVISILRLETTLLIMCQFKDILEYIVMNTWTLV